MRRWIVAIAVGATALGLAGPGQAQTPGQAQAAPADPPDVVALVYQQPGKGALVDMTYARFIPHAQAQADAAALAQASGTPVSASKVTDGEAPVQKKMGVMTGIVFTAPNLIPDDARTLPVEPFITALRHYRRLALIFSVSPGSRFQPLGNYADKNVKIARVQNGTVYTYQVQILNPNFDRLNLPQTQGMAAAPADVVNQRHAPWALLLGLVGAAIAAGILVYALMARKPPVPPASREDPNALSEEQTHLGTKG